MSWRGKCRRSTALCSEPDGTQEDKTGALAPRRTFFTREFLTDIFSRHSGLVGKILEHLRLLVTGATESNDFANLCRFLQRARWDNKCRVRLAFLIYTLIKESRNLLQRQQWRRSLSGAFSPPHPCRFWRWHQAEGHTHDQDRLWAFSERADCIRWLTARKRPKMGVTQRSTSVSCSVFELSKFFKKSIPIFCHFCVNL